MQQLTGGVRAKLGLFAAVGLLGTTYLGASYVGINPLSSGYDITVDLPDAGGLFVNSEVTYRGYQVGEVTDMEPTKDGVRVSVAIDGDAPDIPADSQVSVHNRSAIGEQYLDLQGTGSKDVLEAGDRLTGGRGSLPADLSQVLQVGRDFVGSVPSADLTTVIDEGYNLSRGISDDFTQLLQTSQDFQKTADDNFLVTSSLIRNSGRVLATQEASSQSITSFSKDLSLFAGTLADSDADLRTVLDATPGTARQISLLLSDVGGPLGTLMRNLVPTAEAFGDNSAGLRDTMVNLPKAVSIAWGVTSGRGMNFGLVPTFFDPLPCTQGYGSTPRHRGTDATIKNPANTAAGCTAPRSQTNARGPQAVPGVRATTPNAKVATPDSLDDLLGGSR